MIERTPVRNKIAALLISFQLALPVSFLSPAYAADLLPGAESTNPETSPEKIVPEQPAPVPENETQHFLEDNPLSAPESRTSPNPEDFNKEGWAVAGALTEGGKYSTTANRPLTVSMNVEKTGDYDLKVSAINHADPGAFLGGEGKNWRLPENYKNFSVKVYDGNTFLGIIEIPASDTEVKTSEALRIHIEEPGMRDFHLIWTNDSCDGRIQDANIEFTKDPIQLLSAEEAQSAQEQTPQPLVTNPDPNRYAGIVKAMEISYWGGSQRGGYLDIVDAQLKISVRENGLVIFEARENTDKSQIKPDKTAVLNFSSQYHQFTAQVQFASSVEGGRLDRIEFISFVRDDGAEQTVYYGADGYPSWVEQENPDGQTVHIYYKYDENHSTNVSYLTLTKNSDGTYTAAALDFSAAEITPGEMGFKRTGYTIRNISKDLFSLIGGYDIKKLDDFAVARQESYYKTAVITSMTPAVWTGYFVKPTGAWTLATYKIGRENYLPVGTPDFMSEDKDDIRLPAGTDTVYDGKPYHLSGFIMRPDYSQDPPALQYGYVLETTDENGEYKSVLFNSGSLRSPGKDEWMAGITLPGGEKAEVVFDKAENNFSIRKKTIELLPRTETVTISGDPRIEGGKWVRENVTYTVYYKDDNSEDRRQEVNREIQELGIAVKTETRKTNDRIESDWWYRDAVTYKVHYTPEGEEDFLEELSRVPEKMTLAREEKSILEDPYDDGAMWLQDKVLYRIDYGIDGKETGRGELSRNTFSLRSSRREITATEDYVRNDTRYRDVITSEIAYDVSGREVSRAEISRETEELGPMREEKDIYEGIYQDGDGWFAHALVNYEIIYGEDGKEESRQELSRQNFEPPVRIGAAREEKTVLENQRIADDRWLADKVTYEINYDQEGNVESRKALLRENYETLARERKQTYKNAAVKDKWWYADDIIEEINYDITGKEIKRAEISRENQKKIRIAQETKQVFEGDFDDEYNDGNLPPVYDYVPDFLKPMAKTPAAYWTRALVTYEVRYDIQGNELSKTVVGSVMRKIMVSIWHYTVEEEHAHGGGCMSDFSEGFMGTDLCGTLEIIPTFQGAYAVSPPKIIKAADGTVSYDASSSFGAGEFIGRDFKVVLDGTMPVSEFKNNLQDWYETWAGSVTKAEPWENLHWDTLEAPQIIEAIRFPVIHSFWAAVSVVFRGFLIPNSNDPQDPLIPFGYAFSPDDWSEGPVYDNPSSLEDLYHRLLSAVDPTLAWERNTL